jgi:hypothetical protein
MLPFLHDTEFDSIYHEHYSYFSLLSVQKILSTFQLEIFDVDELSIHGGSLRIYVKHLENKNYNVTYTVQDKGDYVLIVKWGDEHIPGSPFHVTVP